MDITARLYGIKLTDLKNEDELFHKELIYFCKKLDKKKYPEANLIAKGRYKTIHGLAKIYERMSNDRRRFNERIELERLILTAGGLRARILGKRKIQRYTTKKQDRKDNKKHKLNLDRGQIEGLMRKEEKKIESAKALFEKGEKLEEKAEKLKKEGKTKESKIYYKKAVEYYKKAIEDSNSSKEMTKYIPPAFNAWLNSTPKGEGTEINKLKSEMSILSNMEKIKKLIKRYLEWAYST